MLDRYVMAQVDNNAENGNATQTKVRRRPRSGGHVGEVMGLPALGVIAIMRFLGHELVPAARVEVVSLSVDEGLLRILLQVRHVLGGVATLENSVCSLCLLLSLP